MVGFVVPGFVPVKDTKEGVNVISEFVFVTSGTLDEKGLPTPSTAAPPPGRGFKTVAVALPAVNPLVRTSAIVMRSWVPPPVTLPKLSVAKLRPCVSLIVVPETKPEPVRVIVMGSPMTPEPPVTLKPVTTGMGFMTVNGKLFPSTPNGSVRPMSNTVPSWNSKRLAGRLTVNCVVFTNVVVIPAGIKAL